MSPLSHAENESSDSSRYTEKFCSSLLNKAVEQKFDLPKECKQFRGVNDKFERMKESTNKDQAVAFAGMSPADARNAQVARRHGRMNEAQIKRRMTTRGKQSQKSWF